MTSIAQILKIRAILADERCHPAIRANAQRKLDEFRASDPHFFHHVFDAPRRQQRHPGLRESDEYEQLRFADIDRWRKNAKGDRTIVVMRRDTPYRVDVFRKHDAYGWQAVDLETKTAFSSSGYSTMQDAREGAWRWLQTI